MLFRKRLHALFQEKGIRGNLVVACVVVAIVSVALLSDIDVVFVGRTRERDLNAVCKKTQSTHNDDWDAREAFEASEKIERNIRARVSAAREDASIPISGKKKEDEVRTSAKKGGNEGDSSQDKQMFIITVHASIETNCI